MNKHASIQAVQQDAPFDLSLDMSKLSIRELVTAYDGLQTLSDVTAGILGQPRCSGAAETIFDDLWERLNWEVDKATQEIEGRQPKNDMEKGARDYLILASAIDQNSPIEQSIESARRRICRQLDCEDAADLHWKHVESEARHQGEQPDQTNPHASSEEKGYTLDDLDIDFGDLRELLNATYAILNEMPYERNGQRDVELDRVAALVRIAQQFSDKIELNLHDVGPRMGSRWVQRPSGG